MWSALASFALSLAGQVGYHQMLAAGRTVVPQWLVGFAAALPVLVLILGAILVHLMHHDRRKAEELAEAQEAAERQAAAERAEADERAYLRRELDAVTGRHEAAVSELRAELEAAKTMWTHAPRRC
jgi:flagellar biosynthesis/type III secretory pathway M-ring protein FliF/YscJ